MKLTIVDLRPHLEKCRSELRPTKAGKTGDQNAESVSISLNKEGAIRRRWLGLNGKDVYIYKAFLDFYTDASNTNPLSYVDDPIVGDGTGKQMAVPGRYRNAYVIVRTLAEDRYELIQELRLGWIESLVKDATVDYSEGRIESIDWFNGDSGDNPDHNYITVVWKGVDPTKVNAIVTSLDGLSASGWTPTVNGNVLGTFRRLMVRHVEEQDGSSSIRVLLANSRISYDAYENWSTERQGNVIYHFGVPSDMVQEVVNAEKTVGASARISPPDGRGLHDITISSSDPDKVEQLDVIVARNCSSITYMDMYLGLTEAEMNAITLNTVDYPEGNGISYTMRRNSRGDGFWDVVITKEQVLFRDIPAYNAELSAGRTVTIKQDLGNTEATLTEVETIPGKIIKRDINTKPDCSKDIITTEINSIEQSGYDAELTVKYESTGTLLTNTLDDTNPEVPEQGITRHYQRRPQIDGSFDVTIRDDESPILESEERTTTVKTERIGIGARNLRGNKPTPTSPSIGERVIFRVNENADGTWDKNEVIEGIISGLSKSSGVKAACRIITRDVVELNLLQEPAEPDSPTTPGTRRTWNKVENEDGSWELTVRDEIAPSLTSESVLIRKHGGVTETIRRNIAPYAVTETPEWEQGVTVTLRTDENSDCSVDETLREEIAPPLESEQLTQRADRTVAAERLQNTTDKAEVGTVADNVIVRVVNDENPDGTWNTTREVDTPLPQLYSKSYNTRGGTASIYIFKNYTAAMIDNIVDALNAENNNSVNGNPNEYGLYDGSISSSPVVISGSGSAENETPRGYTYTATIDGKTFTVSVKITSFESTAETHASGTSVASSPAALGDQPGVKYIGHGKYKAVRITGG